MSNEDVDIFLAHYGVKGMQWGVIREQQRVISQAEHMKKGTQYKEGLKETLKFLKAYGDIQGLESGDFNRKYVMGKAYLEGKTHTFKKDPSLAHKKDVDALMRDVVKQINPDFGEAGTRLNCRRCTLAYEMRRRGMDVKATLTTTGSGQHVVGMTNAITPGRDNPTRGRVFMKEANKLMRNGVNLWGEHEIKTPNFDDKAFKKKIKEDAKKNGTRKPNWFKRNEMTWNAAAEKKAENVQSELVKQGEGARGELGFGWMIGGGHSVAYEVVRGKAVVFDNQSGQKFETAKELGEMVGMAMDISYTRLDNKPLNDDYLRRWVQDA